MWDSAAGAGDWRVLGGRMQTGNLLVSTVLIMLFTDRVAQPDYKAEDGSQDRHGWWQDTFDGTPIGSRLWQLRRRKIANRPGLANEAADIIREALKPLLDAGIAASVSVAVALAPAGVNSSGNLLVFSVTIAEPNGNITLVRTLWSAVGRGAIVTPTPQPQRKVFRWDETLLDSGATLG